MRNRAAQDFSSDIGRRHPRLRAEALACTLNHLNRVIVLDLCEGGISIEAVPFLTVSDAVHVRLDFLEINTSIEETGEVAWVDPSGRAGVGFRGLSESVNPTAIGDEREGQLG